MASSSTSSPTRVKEYDVFLSFRGADTRNNIVSYLHKALVDVGIRTFKDDKELEEGDIISEKLVNAIQTSWFAVVVLSEKYVTSSWCLEELRHIMELSIQDDITVVPIFYKVEPSDVRYQKNSFEVKLQHYRDPEKILKWKGALTQVGNMSGKHFQTCSDEATNIAEIVSKISNRLRKMKPTDLINLVGMDAHMEKMQLLLDKEPKSEVRMIGILGMGGIGKTAIVNYLYNQFSHEYWAHCFIEDAWNTNDPTHLQRKLLSHICNDENAKLFTREAGAMKIKGILKHKKFFLVIDGVNKAEQVHALAKERSWFGPGSLIIITTRDRGLLNSCGVNNVYEVKCLDSKDALQVFEKFAFGGRNPPFHGSERLFTRASQLAHGLPYALVAFASHLSEQTTIEGWEDELFRLEDYPQKNVEEILRASYDGLDYYEQSVFLQVACLFNGSFLWLIRAFLGKLGSRINSLRAKSLLDISNDGRLIMHFLVEQIGKEIVRQQSNCIPSEQKFLWKPEEIYDVLARNIGTSKIHGVSLEMCDLSDTLRIGSSVFRPMRDLTFLKFLKHVVDITSKLQLISDVSSITHGLKLLHWDAYPLETLPFSFQSSTLVEINLRYSNLKHFWDETKVYRSKLPNLRRLDVTGSTSLVELPDLSDSMNLEELIMEGCRSLRQTPWSLNRLPLRKLNMVKCDSLMGLLLVTDDHNQPKASRPSPYRHINLLLLDTVTALSSLTELSIQGEISVKLLHTLIGSAEHLSFTCEQQIPDQLKITMAQKTGSIQPLHLIKTLVIERFNYGAREAPFSCQSFSSFPCLTELKLINLSIREIPQDIDCLLSLRKMDLTGNDFVHLPKTMAQLTKLECLTLRNCRQLKALPLLTPTLTLPGLDNQPRGLIELCIDNCKNLQSLQDQLLCYNTSLAYLDLSNHDFERIPTSIRHLSSLNTLCLKNCKKLKYVEELPLSLNHLYAHGCDYLENVTLSPNHTIKHLDLRDCPRLKQSEQIKTLVSNERHGEAMSIRISTLSRM